MKVRLTIAEGMAGWWDVWQDTSEPVRIATFLLRTDAERFVKAFAEVYA
jgi:hypothetical protein